MIFWRNAWFGRCFRWASAVMLAAGLGLAGQAMAQQGATDGDLVKKATVDVKNPGHLAGIHAEKLKLDCKACHGNNVIPDDNASKVNESCVGCHGGYDKLGAETRKKAKNPDINVHDSHLGPEIGCTTCHQGHKPSVAYCVNCHTNFDLPIPGGAGKK